MVLLDEGFEELATQFVNLVTDGQWGTGTATPTTTDTGLGTPVAATLLSLNGASSGNCAQFTHEMNSTIGNGSDFTEFELRFANGDSLNRNLGGAITKTASFEIITISTINFTRG